MPEDIKLTPKDLQAIIAGAVQAAVAEAKKPYVSEADVKRVAQEQSERKQQAATVKEIADNKFRGQELCTHYRRDGSTRAVFIIDSLGGYLLCQKCQAVIRQGSAPAGYTGTDHYDGELFNRLFQSAAPMFD